MARFCTSKWPSKKAFLKTPKGHFLVFLRNIGSPRLILWQWDLFLMIRAFKWWLLEWHKTSQHFSKTGYPNSVVFFKMAHETLQPIRNSSYQKPTVSTGIGKFWLLQVLIMIATCLISMIVNFAVIAINTTVCVSQYLSVFTLAETVFWG